LLRSLPALVLTLAALAFAGCVGDDDKADVCANDDNALSRSPFVFVTAPSSGERVSSGFRVSGCSSTFEANVTWHLRGRDGRELASGFITTSAGSLRPGPYRFSVAYSVGASQLGTLEVGSPSASTDEGYPTVRDIVPLVLAA
jgi:hypothetical protein